MLSREIFREVKPEFFRVLAGASARIYFDVLDALEIAASHLNEALLRDEALAIIEAALEGHEGEAIEEDAPAMSTRDKARVILERLVASGWLEEEQRSDWKKLIHFDPNGVTLMHAVRKVARPEAEMFSDKLLNVCATLSNDETVEEQPWAQVETCVDNLQAGLAELRGIQKSIERHTRKQIAAATLKESLSVLFDQFAPRIGRGCYAELVRSRLPTRLAEARRVIDNLAFDSSLLAAMQAEVQRRDDAMTADEAMAHVRQRLELLSDLLEQVVPLADAVDRRTAEFTRRSLARFRYLQEVAGENRGRVQAFFETLNRRFAGMRAREIDEVDFPSLLIHDAQLLAGLESLYSPRLRRSASEIEPLDDETSDIQQDRALGQLNAAMRDSLTVSRANRFVDSLPAKLGREISSEDLPLRTDDELADVIACLLHANAADANFSIHRTEADSRPRDKKLSYRIERFTLVRK